MRPSITEEIQNLYYNFPGRKAEYFREISFIVQVLVLKIYTPVEQAILFSAI